MAVNTLDRRPWWPAVSLALKAALAGLLLFALAHQDWDRFAAKVMGIRAMVYPVAALIAPWSGRCRIGCAGRSVTPGTSTR